MANIKGKLKSIGNALGIKGLQESKLGLNEIRETDIFICSFPKSGNTWLRFIIANGLSKDLITMKNINDFVPGIYNFQEKINTNQSNPRYIKVHHPNYDLFPKMVYIHRDYRDVLVSFFHYSNAQAKTALSWQDFLQSDLLQNPFGTWKNHVERALSFRKANPDQVLVLSYETLLSDTEHQVQNLLNFCGIEPQKSVNEIMELTQFNSLQKLEQKHGTVFDVPGLTFFRSGEKDQWKAHFTKEQLNSIFTPEMRALYDELNYSIE